MTEEHLKVYKRLGAMLSRRREHLGRTQLEVATRVGIASSNFISMIEKGKGKIPMDKARHFAVAYGLSESFFLEVLLRVVYPDFWDAFRLIAAGNGRTGLRDEKPIETLLESIPVHSQTE